MITEATHRDYQAYTLRLWRLNESGGCRATLYSAQTGEHQSFASVEQLCTFLSSLTCTTTEQQQEPHE